MVGMDWFTGILREATARVAPDYFLLPVHGAPSVYRERVYCYELYHQMRLLWPGDCPYRLNGEVDKWPDLMSPTIMLCVVSMRMPG